MKKSIHCEIEMGEVIKELESGVPAELVARNHGVTRATLYNWKSKYSRMEVSKVERLKELEEEPRKLKQMYAELAMDNWILKEVVEINSRVRDKEAIAVDIVEEYEVSIARACKLMEIYRLDYYYHESVITWKMNKRYGQ